MAVHALMPPYLICSTLAAPSASYFCNPRPLQLLRFAVSDLINVMLSPLMPALLAFLLLHSVPQAFLVCKGKTALSAVPPLCFPRMHREGLGARKTELYCQIWIIAVNTILTENKCFFFLTSGPDWNVLLKKMRMSTRILWGVGPFLLSCTYVSLWLFELEYQTPATWRLN